METPKTVMLFTNGNVGVFDKDGQQMPELQKGWMSLWLEFVESKGIDPSKIGTIEMQVNGRNVYAKPFKTENGWNYSFSDF